ncbi:MAG: dephospho-CoA kinase [Puniceicoccales bacterium]|jgi:dephospho-CoA kinase|nr:dephospho-CoA kinase [Puniceicoccales bacterium]
MQIALTGGIACGKSAAMSEFSRLSWGTISADALAHEVLGTPETIALVRDAFGEKILTPANTINRRALGRIVFEDATARKTLESITHPRINTLWRAQIAAGPERRWMVEIPLLFETGLETEFATVLCVHCTAGTQLARLAARGFSEAECRARLTAQLPLEEKVRHATHAIFNEGSLEFLAAQVRALSESMR